MVLDEEGRPVGLRKDASDAVVVGAPGSSGPEHKGVVRPMGRPAGEVGRSLIRLLGLHGKFGLPPAGQWFSTLVAYLYFPGGGGGHLGG